MNSFVGCLMSVMDMQTCFYLILRVILKDYMLLLPFLHNVAQNGTVACPRKLELSESLDVN